MDDDAIPMPPSFILSASEGIRAMWPYRRQPVVSEALRWYVRMIRHARAQLPPPPAVGDVRRMCSVDTGEWSDWRCTSVSAFASSWQRVDAATPPD